LVDVVLVKGGCEGEPPEKKEYDGVREMAERALYVHHPRGHDQYRHQERRHGKGEGFREPEDRNERQYREPLERALFRRDEEINAEGYEHAYEYDEISAHVDERGRRPGVPSSSINIHKFTFIFKSVARHTY